MYGDSISLEYEKENRSTLLLPKITDRNINSILSSNKDIHQFEIDEIIDFLCQVGDLWKNPDYDLRNICCESTREITGYSTAQLELDFDYIAKMLSKKYLLDMVEAELSKKHYLEKWIQVKQSEIRAIPKGRVLHVLAGNVPGVGMISLIRGILSKNSNIVKLASGNPISVLYLIKTFQEVDKNNAITKSISAVYWKREDEIQKQFYNLSDVLCVWGGKKAVEVARSNSHPGQPILEFGPKISVHFIGNEIFQTNQTLKDAAFSAAQDIVLHDQKACFSPKIAFVEGNADRYCESLALGLSEISKRFPKGYVSMDERSTVADTRSICTIIGDKVIRSPSTDWTIILTKKPTRKMQHPLSRTIFIVAVNNLNEALKFINKNTMVVGFSSKETLLNYRDSVTLQGAERTTLLGSMSFLPPGFTSEGTYPISNLVRWVCRDLSESEVRMREKVRSIEKNSFYMNIPWARF